MSTTSANLGTSDLRFESPPPARRVVPPWRWNLRVATRFATGYARYLRTGNCPPEAYADMRRLFRLTNGRFNDYAAALTALVRPPYRVQPDGGVLAAALSPALTGLRRDGAYLFPQRLPADCCARLRAWAERQPCRLVPPPAAGEPRRKYDRANPAAVRYVIDEPQIWHQPDVQRLGSDPSLLALAQGYLGCAPVLTSCVMWWSPAWLDQPSSAAAQLFHFDMSQIRFVKLFIYLTDVGPDNGPHCYVRGTHRRLPAALRSDRRYSDAEVFAHFSPARTLELTGPAGTMFTADTRGLHKGKRVERGQRLVLEYTFSTCGFGDPLARVALACDAVPEIRTAVRRYPHTYRRFTLPKGWP